MTGLALFAAGVAYIALIAQPDSSRWIFIPGLVVAGLGMACTWTLVYNLATRDLRPELAGVASGVLNTIQELGGVIASAAIGAVLQNRLGIGLHEQAVQRADRLPAAFRGPFVDAFSNTHGFEVGAGQTGASLPPGLPADVAAFLQAIGREVFAYAFVDAMRPAMLLAISVVVLAIFAVAAVRRRAQVIQVVEAAA